MKRKQCIKCRKTKSLDEFHKDKNNKDGYSTWYKSCRNKYDRKYREEHQEERRESDRKQREKNREKNRMYIHERRRSPEYRENDYDKQLQRLYGITLREYDLMLKLQEGVCAICGKTPEENGKRLAVDHDHETGEVRGLLCNGCNRGLGDFRDNPEICGLAMSYLYKYGR